MYITSNFTFFRCVLIAFLLIPRSIFSQTPFTEGNILLLRVGDGVSALSTASAPAFVEEYTNSGALVQSIALPASGANQVSLSGINPDGILYRTSDTKRVVFGGYDAPPGTSSISTSSSVVARRLVGSLNVTGNYSRAALINGTFTGVPIRSVCSSGSDFWGVSTGFLATGVVHITALSAQQICTSPTNFSCVREFNNQLYAATPNSPYHIYSIGTGLPVTNGQTATTFLNPTGVGTGNPQVSDFVLNAGSTICYIADARTVSGGGIQRWSYNGTAWVHDYTLSTGTDAGARNLTVDFSGAFPVIHAIANDLTGTRYVQITDTGNGSVYNDLVVSTSNTMLKGIAFTPTCTYGCTNPLACNFDPAATCDDNSCTGTLWYADQDGDMAYNPVNSILSCLSPGAGYFSSADISNLSLSPDCDDSNALINPNQVEICGNGLDDNCDGWIDNECAGGGNNDIFAGATLVSISGSAYPAGNCYNATLATATISPQGLAANVSAGGGADRWYRFTTLSTAARVVCTTSTMNVVLELHGTDGSFIASQNSNSAPGSETWILTNLTAGTTYALAVRCADVNPGAYALCIQNFAYSQCADGSGSYDLCTNFKPTWTGASSYTFTFTPTGLTPGSATSASTTNQIALSGAALNLRHNGTYDVSITTNYVLSGYGTLSLTSPTGCSIQIDPHADLQVKQQQRCTFPAVLLPGSRLQGKPFVCGAIGYEVEFQEVTDCSGTNVIGLPFVKTISSSAAQLQLNFTSPQPLQAGAFYAVRWKPLFTYGAGDFGTAHVIRMSSSSSELQGYEEEANTLRSKSEFMLFPNPVGDRNLNLWSETRFDGLVEIQLYSSTGSLVQTFTILAVNQNQIQLKLDETLSSGVYVLMFKSGSNTASSVLLLD